MFARIALKIAAMIVAGIAFIFAMPWLFFGIGGLITEALPFITDDFYKMYAGGMIGLVLPIFAVYAILGLIKMRAKMRQNVG